MKKMRLLFLLVAFMAFGTIAQAQVLWTSMMVTTLDDKGNVQRGTTVKIYASEDDYDNDENVVAEGKTDEKGRIKFKKIEAQSYFIRAEKGELTNEDGAVQTGGLIEKKLNKVNIIMEKGIPDIK
ncbi:hypothetical protein R9C00_28530 [Flammeovirgaceae bacterium SG7u.111]|nr:hypothetical protein [Flammeovirgaceae bacterium SG7u.132]WPO35648.1 hypothetical protein R9C00_28530 [Flammeovirgaceae bacterium SG7u.111]